jgi:hypothetical protein
LYNFRINKKISTGYLPSSVKTKSEPAFMTAVGCRNSPRRADLLVHVVPPRVLLKQSIFRRGAAQLPTGISSPDGRVDPSRPQPRDHSRKRPYVAGVSETSSHCVVSAGNPALVGRAFLGDEISFDEAGRMNKSDRF